MKKEYKAHEVEFVNFIACPICESDKQAFLYLPCSACQTRRPTKRAADSPKAGAKSAVSRVRKSKVIRPAKSG